MFYEEACRTMQPICLFAADKHDLTGPAVLFTFIVYICRIIEYNIIKSVKKITKVFRGVFP